MKKLFRQLRLAIALVTEGKRARWLHILGWCIWIMPALWLFIVWWLLGFIVRSEDLEGDGYHG